jgi:hypothetical protein
MNNERLTMSNRQYAMSNRGLVNTMSNYSILDILKNNYYKAMYYPIAYCLLPIAYCPLPIE